MNKGILFVVSGPSGAGKGTVLKEVLMEDKNIHYSVSMTTRKMRPGEIDGASYHFVSKEYFEDAIKNGKMLEYALYCENYYGTPLDIVEDVRNKGKDVVLEIELKGAMQIKEKCSDAVMVFVMPPSITELHSRLLGRGTEAPEVVKKRMDAAVDEIKQVYKYDYVVVNNEVKKAAEDLKTIIKAERLKAIRNPNFINEVLNDVIPISK